MPAARAIAVAAPGAVVYVQVPSAGSLQLKHLRPHAFRRMASLHRTIFSLEGLRRLLSEPPELAASGHV